MGCCAGPGWSGVPVVVREVTYFVRRAGGDPVTLLRLTGTRVEKYDPVDGWVDAPWERGTVFNASGPEVSPLPAADVRTVMTAPTLR